MVDEKVTNFCEKIHLKKQQQKMIFAQLAPFHSPGHI